MSLRTSRSTSQKVLTLVESQQQWSFGRRFERDPLNEEVWRVKVGEQAFYFNRAARAREFYEADHAGLVVLTMPRGQDWGSREGEAS